MRDRVCSLWIVVAALLVLGACAPALAGNGGDPANTGLSATLEAPTRLPDGAAVMLRFTLTNNSDETLFVLKWYTPLEGIAGEIFTVERDGQSIPYTGILATRGDPTAGDYVRLEAGQSLPAKVDLATAFDFSQPGEYTVAFLSPRISHVARPEAEMARSVDELGPVDIPANTVTVQIGSSTGELSEPTAGEERLYYQGASPFYPDGQPFELAYAPSVWDYVPGDAPNHADHLRHREMADCSLWLGEGGAGATPVSTVHLAGHEWTISQIRPDFLQFTAGWDRGVWIFGLRLPDQYQSDLKGSCQQAAEEVLSTIEETGRPLPPSMKGYELYSWYEDADDAWYYTLITGTNRLKTLEEIRARTNVGGPDGWVSIMVRGTGPLQTLLQRLPPGEQLIWIGAEWLEQVGAEPDMVETMRLPGSATVAEIEDVCRQRGLTLNVTGAPSAAATPEPTTKPARTLVLETEDEDGPGAVLVIHETPIVEAGGMGPGRFEYDDQLGPEVLAQIATLRGRSAARALARTNAVLAPFGYHLEPLFDAGRNKTLYDLYGPGEAEPLARLLPLWRQPLTASVNASGSDFVLVAENGAGTGPMYWLVDSHGPREWEPTLDPSLRPGYGGDALAQITATGDVTFTYQVELDGRPVYTGTAALTGAYMPLRSFTTWDDHWLLEVDDHLIMDGRDLGQDLGYDAAYGFARIGDRSFYFFEQKGLAGISYGDQVLPGLYEQVFHNQCCEAVIHNVETGPDAVWFHAQRAGTWYWVEAGLDEPATP